MKKFLPFLIFVFLAAVLAVPLLKNKGTGIVDSALIGKPSPALPMTLPENKPLVVNFFASWCVPCVAEQPVLMQLEKTASVYGVVYKDKKEAAAKFLKQHGNPYRDIGFDTDGRTAIDWGVYGVPETFVIDRKGIVRYRHAGPLTAEDSQKIIQPLLLELQK